MNNHACMIESEHEPGLAGVRDDGQPAYQLLK